MRKVLCILFLSLLYACGGGGDSGPPPDTTPPDTTITSNPENPSPETTGTFTFVSSEGASTFECSLDSSQWTFCQSPKSYPGLDEGPHSFSVKATDAAGNTDPTPANYLWTIDTTGPSYNLTSTPDNPTTETSATFEFTTDADVTWCRVDDGAWDESCLSPDTHENLAVGNHSWEIKVFDSLGNEAGEVYLWEIIAEIIDDDAPETTIDSGPNDPTNETSATFTYSSDDSNATFEIRISSTIDGNVSGGEWISKGMDTSHVFDSLLQGNHTVDVRATDQAGNIDATPAQWSWTVDLSMPETTITNDPPDFTDSQSITFEFESNEPNSTFECEFTGDIFWISCRME